MPAEGGTSPKRDRAASTPPIPTLSGPGSASWSRRSARLRWDSSEPSAPARPAPALLRPAHRFFTQSLRACAESRIGTRNTRNSAKKDSLSCLPRLFRVFRVLHDPAPHTHRRPRPRHAAARRPPPPERVRFSTHARTLPPPPRLGARRRGSSFSVQSAAPGLESAPYVCRHFYRARHSVQKRPRR